MGYRISRRADADLDHLYLIGTKLFGVAQAEDYMAGLMRTLEFLAAFPQAARERMEFDPPVRAHPYKSHLLVYRVESEDILIVRVPHGHEDWQGGLS